MQAGKQVHRSVHAVGVLSTIWGLIAWTEWILVPIFYPEAKQFIPYGIRFLPQLLLLQTGCFLFCTGLVVTAVTGREWALLSYGLVPFSYLAFHVCRWLAAF